MIKIPSVNFVLPEPSSPVKTTTSVGFNKEANFFPKDKVSFSFFNFIDIVFIFFLNSLKFMNILYTQERKLSKFIKKDNSITKILQTKNIHKKH